MVYKIEWGHLSCAADRLAYCINEETCTRPRPGPTPVMLRCVLDCSSSRNMDFMSAHQEMKTTSMGLSKMILVCHISLFTVTALLLFYWAFHLTLLAIERSIEPFIAQVAATLLVVAFTVSSSVAHGGMYWAGCYTGRARMSEHRCSRLRATCAGRDSRRPQAMKDESSGTPNVTECSRRDSLASETCK